MYCTASSSPLDPSHATEVSSQLKESTFFARFTSKKKKKKEKMIEGQRLLQKRTTAENCVSVAYLHEPCHEPNVREPHDKCIYNE
mmetsp:Transcript_37512/g.43790  ORF Transcript_37512/g.43790 Transcript_37512/m.43790 type:complete len:85 (-) Transcript_37512:148-402(-)